MAAFGTIYATQNRYSSEWEKGILTRASAHDMAIAAGKLSAATRNQMRNELKSDSSR